MTEENTACPFCLESPEESTSAPVSDAHDAALRLRKGQWVF